MRVWNGFIWLRIRTGGGLKMTAFYDIASSDDGGSKHL
jgi:hypothetical protein